MIGETSRKRTNMLNIFNCRFKTKTKIQMRVEKYVKIFSRKKQLKMEGESRMRLRIVA